MYVKCCSFAQSINLFRIVNLLRPLEIPTEFDLLSLFPDGAGHHDVATSPFSFAESNINFPSADEEPIDHGLPVTSAASVDSILDESYTAWTAQLNHDVESSTRLDSYGDESEQFDSLQGQFLHHPPSDQANGPCETFFVDEITLPAATDSSYSPSEYQQLPLKRVPPASGKKYIRGLPRRRSRYNIDRLGAKTTPVFIPTHASSSDPLTRWQQSPPEDEAASLSAIKNAFQSSNQNNNRTKTKRVLILDHKILPIALSTFSKHIVGVAPVQRRQQVLKAPLVIHLINQPHRAFQWKPQLDAERAKRPNTNRSPKIARK